MIVVLNFGSQYTHLIARRVRDLGVYAEILPFDSSSEAIKKLSPKGIILSGGPACVCDKSSPFPEKGIFSLGIPILGICYGQQIIANVLGGKVEKGKIREYGREVVSLLNESVLFKGCNSKELVWFSHGDKVVKIPSGFKKVASSKSCSVAGFENKSKKIWGIQFHPEVTHTKNGLKILKNFLYCICKEKNAWKISDAKNSLVSEIKKEVGSKSVLIGVSGGVDSLVAATLLKNAIKDNLYCVLVDNGLLRKNEVKEMRDVFEKMNFSNFLIVDASSIFLNKLKGVTDPEEKRKIIGHTFIRVFEEKAKELEKKTKIKFLAQGTIYPDRIESAQPSKTAAKIKSHHNLTLPSNLKLQIIEPIKDFYKDEVRRLGKELGLSQEILERHPFPGPGLAVRIVGEITKERLNILREADHIFICELKNFNQYNKIWQAFVVLLPLKTVGVMGDSRTYDYIISLRAVTSIDGMTADWAKIPSSVLEKVSSRIINEVKGVNRVVYDISQKPPATIEYE